MKTFVFLDIEGTLIEDFDNPSFIEAHKNTIKEIILGNEVEIRCFSWAICNRAEFENCSHIIESIEDFFGFKFTRIVFRDSLFKIFKSKFGDGLTFIEFADICNSLGKETIFQIFIREQFIKEVEVNAESNMFILVDDRVQDTVLTVDNLIIQTKRIDST